MNGRTPRERTLSGLRAVAGTGAPLVVASAGSGLAARAAETGGADLVAVYNSGRFRTAGLGSLASLLPFADANAIVLELAQEVLSQVDAVPVLAGVCAQSPRYDLDGLVGELAAMGVSGIQNFPTTALYGDGFRDDLEATGIHFESEVELMRAARRAGLLGCAFVCTVDQARRMALAGVDVIAPHLGVTRPGASEQSLAEAAVKVDELAAAARAVCDDVLVVFHGGPAVTADDERRVLALADGVDGFIAASAVERHPVLAAVSKAVREFKQPLGADESAVAPSEQPDFDTPAPALPFELTVESLPRYLRERGLAPDDGEMQVEELGGGLSNMVLGWRAGDERGIVKQARPKARVAEEWLLDVRRIQNESAAIALLAERVPAGHVPTVTFADDEACAFGMVPAPEHARLWKPELLAGRLDPGRALQAGRQLAELQQATRDDPGVARRFVARPLLDQTRLDPWYRAAGLAHLDLTDAFEYAIERLLTVRRVLVHGDFAPKNMFLLEDGLLVIDYEVAHYGNPGYDVATFVNHMLLKGFRAPEHAGGFSRLSSAFWDAYSTGHAAGAASFVEQEALVQIGPLMLARVDGRSTVEYLDAERAAEARSFGRRLVRHRPGSIRELLDAYDRSKAGSRQ